MAAAYLKVGGKGKLLVRSDLAYGMMGDPASGVLDNEDLSIEIEILAVGEPADASGVMSDEQKLQKMEEIKERATQEYRASKF